MLQIKKMIPLYKLNKLPRIQKLRKIAKTFSMAENRLGFCKAENKLAGEKGAGIFTLAEIQFFTDAAKLLAEDFLFNTDAQRLFKNAAGFFEKTIQGEAGTNEFLRVINNIKHLLHAETGRDQADWDFTDCDGKLDPASRQIFEGMYVYLEDIRSPFNVGAMFRTAESFGVEKIYLSPFCADPHHRRSERTAMGCVDIVPWERRDFFPAPETSSFLPDAQPLPVFALETGGTRFTDFAFPRRGLLIAGSEELGVSPQALAAADTSLGRVSIPCYGSKASLNVSVAFGIALQAWTQAFTS